MKVFKLVVIFFVIPFLAIAQNFNADEQVETYLQHHLSELNLSQDDILDYHIYREYYSEKTALTHVFLQQQYHGISIHKAEIRLHFHKEKSSIITQNTFVKDLNSLNIQSESTLTDIQAIQYACNALDIVYSKPNRLNKKIASTSLFSADFSLDVIPVKASYLLVGDQLTRVWDLTIYEKDATDCWNVLIDAQSGELLRKYNWVQHCSFSAKRDCEHNHVITTLDEDEFSFSSSMGAGTYNVFAVPIESPSHGDRSLEVDPHNTDASPFGWHDINGDPNIEYTITRGNNVHAYADLNDTGSPTPGFPEPDGGSELYFDFPFDPMAEPDQNLDAATVNLFYMTNMMHDVWYHYGFDPAAGNFQSFHYDNQNTQGGLAGDYVYAQAQDSSGVGTNIALDNANFYTPSDGNNPVMQMYIWNKPENPFDLFTVNSPDELTGHYEVSPAGDWGGQITSDPITANIEHVDDGTTWGQEGCGELINDLTGKIALVSRGTCEFGVKSLNAQNAGAVAVIIYNNVGGIVNMAAGAVGADVTIPSVFMGKLDGELLRDNLLADGVVNATFVNNSPPGPDYLDGDFDNGIIAHEYGHGISTRLTGSNCLYGDEQAGEGWSDFFALMMTNTIDDNGEEPHGIGTYVSAEQNDGRGIRSYPYSRDMDINPMTYDYIITESVPHGVGSVLATVLWDLYWNFVDLYGYDTDRYNGTGGNNMVMQLVIDGLKLQACGATFIDIRESILVADELLYEGQNNCLIWETFARRGIGFSADGGTASSRGDGQEAFDILPECVKELKIQKTANADAKAGDELTFTLTVQNHTDNQISDVFVKDTLQSGISYVASSSSCDLDVDGDILTFSLGNLSSGENKICTYSVLIDENFYSEILFEDDMEDGDDYWISLSEEGFVWELDAPEARSGDKAWFAENLEDRYEALLELEPFVVSGDAPTLSFWHKYITEPAFDGGYISISTDESNFEDLGPHIIRGHYRGVSQGSPPLGGKDSYWGNSNGFVNTLVDLSPYVGESVIIRFTFVADEGNQETEVVEGWTVDDVRILDRYEINNRACVYGDSQLFSSSNYICDETHTMVYDHYGISIDEVQENVFAQIFPNPSNNYFSIRLTGEWRKQFEVKVYDVQGKLIFENQGYASNINIATNGYAEGLYFVEINDGIHQMVKKITVQH